MKIDSVMIDLETMGTGPNAAVVQVGAVGFNLETGEVDPDGFLMDVDLMSSLEAGGRIHQATVDWWAEQGGFKPATANPAALHTVLYNLRAFIGDLKWAGDKHPRVWCQGLSFDCAILEGYAERLKVAEMWPYNKGRDTRTIYDLARTIGWEKPDGCGPTHQAQEDCLAQIKALLSAYEDLGRCLYLQSA